MKSVNLKIIPITTLIEDWCAKNRLGNLLKSFSFNQILWYFNIEYISEVGVLLGS